MTDDSTRRYGDDSEQQSNDPPPPGSGPRPGGPSGGWVSDSGGVPSQGMPAGPMPPPGAMPPPGWRYPGPPPGPPPNNHMAFAIVATILCCLPLGIVSIVKASEVNNHWAMGQFAAAHESAESARKFAMWSMIAMGIVIGLVIVMYLIFGAVAVTTYA